MARSKCTPELTKRVCRQLAAGNWIETACALAGISPSTYHAWVARGEAELERVASHPNARVQKGERRYVDFSEACARARARAEARSLARIQTAARGQEEAPADWKADAWFLERAHPRRWGRQQVRHEHSGPNGGPIEIAPFDITAEVDRLKAEGEGDAKQLERIYREAIEDGGGEP